MLYLVIGSLILGMALIILLALAAANTELFAENFSLVLTLTGVAAGALALLFAYQVVTLWRRVKAGVFGARLTARMFWLFGLMAMVPGLVVYGVSVQFIAQSIESWFDVRMEKALESGLSLGQSSLDHLERELVKKAENAAQQLAEQPAVLQLSRLNDLRETANLQEVSLFDASGRLLGFASSDKAALVPEPPDQTAVWQARLQQPWSRIETGHEWGALLVRVVVPVNLISLTEDLRLLQVTQPAPAKLSLEALSVEQAHRDYQELAVSRLGLKRLYGLSLTLALVLTLFASLSLAFILSERLAAPLRALARGTRAVARGDYSQVYTVASRDELGMLTQSFNRMTQQLAEARTNAQDSHDKLLEANAYLESVLGSVNTGVVTLGHDLRVNIVNPAAAAILGKDRGMLEDRLFGDWGEAGSGLQRFGATMAEHFQEAGNHAWREQVEFDAADGMRVLLARGTPLSAGEAADYALVFDDVTQLIQAQRDAAWGEVARRLAHEIKNPLTPIQLSAERLQIKLGDKLDDPSRQVLTRATGTIVNQVAALKALVNAFAEYARMPAPNIQRLDLNHLVEEVLALYEGHLPIDIALADGLQPVAGDPTLLRQVLVNLIKNAEEAMAETPEPRVYLRTHASVGGVVLCVEDNGPGFPETLMKRLFEPYATTKPKGTGLGLAIVKKIVEEHHGSIEVRNLDPVGASICVTLPVLEAMENGHE
jgi:nitrogen fixation/metabolism regulation signal transduction histidine kinase